MASRQRSKVSVPEDAPYAVNFIFSVKVGWHVPDQASATSLEGRGSVGDHRTSHRESSVHTTSIASGSGACHPSYALLAPLFGEQMYLFGNANVVKHYQKSCKT
jgi:hypothetical protein